MFKGFKKHGQDHNIVLQEIVHWSSRSDCLIAFTVNTSGRLCDDFLGLLFFHAHLDTSVLTREFAEESDQFHFLHPTSLHHLKGSVGLTLTKPSLVHSLRALSKWHIMCLNVYFTILSRWEWKDERTNWKMSRTRCTLSSVCVYFQQNEKRRGPKGKDGVTLKQYFCVYY
jgi:hypothetical protein